MKWLILFSVAFLGFASCKNDICLTTKLQVCIALKRDVGISDNKPCTVAGIIKECVQEAEKECKKEDPDLKEFISVIDDVCKEGSESNKKFNKHFPCLTESMKSSTNCVASILKDVNQETTEDPEKVKELLKKVCKQMDSIVTCFEKNIEDICTADVKTFFRKLYNPVLNMAKNTCEEILNDDASSSRAISWLVNLSVLVFLFFWYVRR